MAKILVVEDETTAVQSIREFLECSEHTVVSHVESGWDAVQVATAIQPDLVLIDISIPGAIDGVSAATQISRQLNIPIVYLTATVENDALQRAIAVEPFGYLVKPFNSIELSTAITIALYRHRPWQDESEGDRVLAPSLDRHAAKGVSLSERQGVQVVAPVLVAASSLSAQAKTDQAKTDQAKTDQAKTESRLQAEREALLSVVSQQICQSLDLDYIFNLVVRKVCQLFRGDRGIIYRLQTDRGGSVIAESVVPGWSPMLGQPLMSSRLAVEPWLLPIMQGEPSIIDDFAAGESSVELKTSSPILSQPILSQFNVQAQLAIPLLQGEVVWGVLAVQQCETIRCWQSWEIDWLQRFAVQLTIAIQQSELCAQVQRLNAELERQVSERTTLFQQVLDFEALLKRITDKVRDSLDEYQIMQVAVEELGLGLQVECCSAALFNGDQTSASVTYEYTTSMPSACGKTLLLAEQPDVEVYYQLLRGESLQFCYTIANPLRPTKETHAILACPIVDDRGVLGDLWLFKPKHNYFSDIEQRLVAQVANQCAIALRQSRLFQAVQAQVSELKRLNHLKTDFLSTISHELRTPMSNIKMAIQMLEIALNPSDALNPEGVASRYFKILQTECQHEINLIDDLLNLSRLDAGTEPLILSTIDPSIWISHAVEPFLDRIRTQQQHLILDLPTNLPPLITDLSCLGRILAELMDNACKYTPSGEQILVSAKIFDKPKLPEIKSSKTPGEFKIHNSLMKPQNLKSLHISVSNSGSLIPPEELPHIFDTFYRIPTSDPWRHSGTGLGLALVKKLAAHLGVSIQVNSSDGQTTFTLTFFLRESSV
jgi:signal transduction histidine kinase/CheY-like chemotaxis protein